MSDPHANPKAMLLNMRGTAHRAYQEADTTQGEIRAIVAFCLIDIALTLRSFDEYGVQTIESDQ